jgi:hypothetical protein
MNIATIFHNESVAVLPPKYADQVRFLCVYACVRVRLSLSVCVCVCVCVRQSSTRSRAHSMDPGDEACIRQLYSTAFQRCVLCVRLGAAGRPVRRPLLHPPLGLPATLPATLSPTLCATLPLHHSTFCPPSAHLPTTFQGDLYDGLYSIRRSVFPPLCHTSCHTFSHTFCHTATAGGPVRRPLLHPPLGLPARGRGRAVGTAGECGDGVVPGRRVHDAR